MTEALKWAAAGTGFTFFMTALGASMVFFFKSKVSAKLQNAFLGFASGVMIAASIWSLIIPAIEQVEEEGGVPYIPAAGGFIIGVLFLFLLDKLMPHLHSLESSPEGMTSGMKSTSLLMVAVTLHNIPEGMAVGLAFALAAQQGAGGLAPAVALAVGMGIQNFPEGAAISLPLRQEGFSRSKAFAFGTLSGAVEPVFGILIVFVASFFSPLMPWMLCFAAGAMMYVVVEELIPRANEGQHSDAGTMGAMAGFVIMMILDVALG